MGGSNFVPSHASSGAINTQVSSFGQQRSVDPLELEEELLELEEDELEEDSPEELLEDELLEEEQVNMLQAPNPTVGQQVI